MQRSFVLALALFAATGCRVPGPGVTPVASSAPTLVTLGGTVRAPLGVVAQGAGNLLTQDGAGVVSQGGGNAIGNNGSSYGLLDVDQSGLAKAVVFLADPTGQPLPGYKAVVA